MHKPFKPNNHLYDQLLKTLQLLRVPFKVRILV